MIRIAICDDEKQILDEVSAYIKNYAEKKNNTDIQVFRFDSASMLLSALEDEKTFDIFVLDVYIGEEMGTDLARNIRKFGIESPIIFATTSVEHAPQSYETGTLRYLIKPINPAKFYEAMDVAVASAEKLGQRRKIQFRSDNAKTTDDSRCATSDIGLAGNIIEMNPLIPFSGGNNALSTENDTVFFFVGQCC